MIGRKTPSGALIASDEDFVRYLLEDAGVGLVFGAAFGMSPHFRVSYAASDDVLVDACDRIAKACAELR
jgi:aspartate aminotransferase